MLANPETVNQVTPPKIPANEPPNVATKINKIALMIVPNAPASAAFQRPPIGPECAIYPVINPTINNPMNSYGAKNAFTITASMKPMNTALHLAMMSPFYINIMKVIYKIIFCLILLINIF